MRLAISRTTSFTRCKVSNCLRTFNCMKSLPKEKLKSWKTWPLIRRTSIDAIWPKLPRLIGLRVLTEVPWSTKAPVALAGHSLRQLCKRLCRAWRRENLSCACPNRRDLIATLPPKTAMVAGTRTTGTCQKRLVPSRMLTIHTKIGATKAAGTSKTRRLLQRPLIQVG